MLSKANYTSSLYIILAALIRLGICLHREPRACLALLLFWYDLHLLLFLSHLSHIASYGFTVMNTLSGLASGNFLTAVCQETHLNSFMICNACKVEKALDVVSIYRSQ